MMFFFLNKSSSSFFLKFLSFESFGVQKSDKNQSTSKRDLLGDSNSMSFSAVLGRKRLKFIPCLVMKKIYS